MAVRDYTDALYRLAPRRWVERFERFRALLQGLAPSLETVDEAVVTLRDEADIRTASAAALARWAVVYDCDATEAAVTAAALARGGATPQHFIDIADAAGVTITITTYAPLMYGIGSYGDPMYDAAWAYHWHVNGTVPDWLQDQITALKPAHTTVSFD